MADGLSHGHDLSDRQRLRVRLGLTAILLAVWGYLVPFELWQLRSIHDEQASDIASLEGFETLEARANWIPSFSGATVVLQPLDGRAADDLVAELLQLGWTESDGPKSFVRSRSDEHRSEWLDVVERTDSMLRVTTRVERLGRAGAAPLLTVLALVFALVFLKPRIVHAHEFRIRPPGYH